MLTNDMMPLGSDGPRLGGSLRICCSCCDSPYLTCINCTRSVSSTCVAEPKDHCTAPATSTYVAESKDHYTAPVTSTCVAEPKDHYTTPVTSKCVVKPKDNCTTPDLKLDLGANLASEE